MKTRKKLKWKEVKGSILLYYQSKKLEITDILLSGNSGQATISEDYIVEMFHVVSLKCDEEYWFYIKRDPLIPMTTIGNIEVNRGSRYMLL